MLALLFFSLLVGINGDSYGCPNNVTCFEKETCCETNTGLWACCPIESGVCCDDGLHCCSKDQKCLPNGNCTSSTNEISFSFSLRETPIKVQTVPCPDGSSCPDDNTCCQLSSGQYGCCPIRDAVCCSDDLHCCPNGYTCDVEHSRCKKKFDQSTDVPCPGGSSECPDGTTCCQLQSGDYGCCPLVDAVCCSDHLHCCPHGYRCDVEKGECLQEISIPWFGKKQAFRRHQNFAEIINSSTIPLVNLNVLSEDNSEIVCPDATSLCPSTSTCCLSSDSMWSCCPIENAVCCSDHIHCCPTHYKCDLHIFKCDHSIHGTIPLLKKELSLKKISSNLISSSSLSTIQCPDQTSTCPEDTTCCLLDNGAYGCCPYPEASCCSDKIHCCGNGYSCDPTGKRCISHFNSFNQTIEIRSTLKIQSIKKFNDIHLLSSLKRVKDQTCPDGKTKCSPTTTCCPNNGNDSISYSCCPYAKGVCCGRNGSVCCPNSYTCDDKQLSCQLTNSKIRRSAPVETDFSQCGTSNFGCSFDQTCCKTTQTTDEEYACCAFPNAQCCADGRHCCPKGSKCDIKSGGCVQDD